MFDVAQLVTLSCQPGDTNTLLRSQICCLPVVCPFSQGSTVSTYLQSADRGQEVSCPDC